MEVLRIRLSSETILGLLGLRVTVKEHVFVLGRNFAGVVPLFCCGVGKRSSRQSHNLEIVGSNPAPATNLWPECRLSYPGRDTAFGLF